MTVYYQGYVQQQLFVINKQIKKMNSWQEMKDFSYVGLKLTKAKSVCQGLARCKIQKLTRKNPIYQHLAYHKKFKKQGGCALCVETGTPVKEIIRKNKKSTFSLKGKMQDSRKCHTENLRFATEPVIVPQKQSKRPKTHIQKWVDTILVETPKDKISRAGKRLKEELCKLSQSLNRSKSHFNRIDMNKTRTQDYFYNAINDIELEMDEDKGLSLREVKTDYQKIKEDMNEQMLKMKKLRQRVKTVNKQVVFPFTTDQMIKIVDSKNKQAASQSKKLKRMITNLYEYKSSKNYRNRMKIIGSIVNK